MQFNSIQQGLAFAFQGFKFNTYNLGHPDDPCFAGPELVPIFGARDSYDLTRRLDKDEVITINVRQFPAVTAGNLTSPLGGNPTISFITLPGLFSLISIMGRRNPNIHEFDRYIRHDVLPTLYYNPQLVEQINDLTIERNIFRDVAKSSMSELYANRRQINNLKRCNENGKRMYQNLQDSYERLIDFYSDPSDLSDFD